MKTNFKTKLYDLLKKDSRLWDEEKKVLNETLLKDLIDKLDEKLIEVLLSDKETNKKFFVKVKDVYVLKQNELKFFIDENKLDNSYTQYQNKIGLKVGNKLLSERDEVVLDWPFKDCVLEGGMTKEDQKRNEIFFNEILAKDEIDRLFDPKALVNWKRYTAKGEEKIKALKRDKDGTIRENLIVKGNNLLVLHSLKEQFTGKVKLIYIDPPYNRSSDSFNYNDNFNHSTWLTFMKNRIKIAKELLSQDGAIFISIDEIELEYLKTLLDDQNIFGRENHVGTISVVNNLKGRSDDQFIATANEFLLVYAKNKKDFSMKGFELSETQRKEYDQEDEFGRFKEVGFRKTGKGWRRIDRRDMFYPIYYNPNTNEVSLDKKTGFDIEILPLTREGFEGRWRWGRDTFLKNMRKDILVKKVREMRSKAGPYRVFTKMRLNNDDGETRTLLPKSIWIDPRYDTAKGDRDLKEMIGENEFENPKPVDFVKDIIKIASDEGDIIVDFFAGSGTSGQAVMESKDRYFILCEQLDYIDSITLPRLKATIKKRKIDNTFICLELAKWNEEAKEKILKAKSLTELEKLFDELYERYFLNYNVKTKEFKEKILKEEEFKSLSLDEQKNLFVETLDMNQMYVNFSERADKKYNLSKEDIDLSEIFYNSRR